MINKKATAFQLTRNATILTLGLFMTIGGTSCNKDSSSSDLLGDWQHSSDFEGVARTEAVSFVLGDKAYVGTGYQKDDVRLSDFWQYDQTNGTWYQVADMPGVPRNSAVAFTIGDKAYVGTGYDGTNYLNDFYSYNPANDTWDTIAPFAGSARTGAVAFGLGSFGYVGTGYDDNYLKDFWGYNPSNDTWSQAASLGGTKRQDAVAFVVNSKAYVVTGLNNGAYTDDMWEFTPAATIEAGTWNQKIRTASISDDAFDDDYGGIPRSNATAFVMDNIAFVTGGANGGNLTTTWSYDASTDRWTEKTPFEGTVRQGAVSFTLNNRGYITTGNNSGTRFDDMWEFLPNADQVDYN